MPRIARIVAAGYPHHITQRGNYQQKIFTDDTDREQYLSFLKKESKKYGLMILAYCLMPNHVHFIGIPKKKSSLGEVFKYAHMQYSQYYNKKMRTAGHLFQGRFFSCIMNEQHTLACARYIERNPVRAKLVKKPYLWKWSSAKVHWGIDKHDELEVNKLFDYVEEKQKNWKTFMKTPDNLDEVTRIRQQTLKGRPLGGNDFIEKLETKLKRVLKLKPKGRPKKKLKK